MNKIIKQGKILIISFVLILSFCVYFFILSYQNKKQAEILSHWVIHTHMVIQAITNLDMLVTEFEAEDQSYVITNDKSFISDLDSRQKKAPHEFEKIKKLTADNKVQQKYLELLSKVIDAKIEHQSHIFEVLSKSHEEGLRLLANPETKRLYAEIKSILALMLKEENNLLRQRTAKYDKALHNRFEHSNLLAIFALSILTIAFWKIYNEGITRKKAEEELKKSEAKYKRLVENSSLILFTTDLHGHFTYISAKGLELTGYKMDELIGKPFSILVPEDQKNELSNFYLRQYKDFVKDLVEEFKIKTKDNTIKIIQLGLVLIEENHKVVGFQSIARDITEVKYIEDLIKESQLKLRRQQEEYTFRLQSVIDNIPMELYIKDLEGRFIMVNKTFTTDTGWTNEMIAGKTNSEILHDKEKAELLDNVDERVKKTCKPIEFEETVITERGEKNLLITKFPLFDKNNNLFAISGVSKDITDMVFQRQQLIDARLKAERAEQLQESFLANMSHEIRTPMNGIIGMTDMILDTNLTEEQKEYARLIKKSSDTLLILINDILDLSKIKAGRMELEIISFNIKEAIKNVVQPMKLNLKKDVVLTCAISDAVPDSVKGDSHKLFQILNNLLSNALKFTERGEIKVNIDTLKKSEEKILIKIDVADTGIGIFSEHINHIFESFTQAGNDTVRRFGGTGLGLTITKKLVELQGGTISVESTLGAGSVFHVEIPYLPDNVNHTGSSTDTSADIKIKKESIANKRILVVEDNLINQKVLTGVLQKVKARWDIANNGKEAIDKLEKGNVYDLIIMDLQMPVMDGFQATSYIREKLKLDTPIIAMTASALRNERVKCFEVGMNDYLSKPFSPGDLINQIHNLINRIEIKQKQMEQEQVPPEKLYDLEYLYELEDNNYLVEMLELFIETTTQMLQEIDENIRSKNWDAVGKISHKLKSALGPLQISKMVSIASEIEENAKNSNNQTAVIDLNMELHNQYNLVKPMIEAELVKARKLAMAL